MFESKSYIVLKLMIVKGCCDVSEGAIRTLVATALIVSFSITLFHSQLALKCANPSQRTQNTLWIMFCLSWMPSER